MNWALRRLPDDQCAYQDGTVSSGKHDLVFFPGACVSLARAWGNTLAARQPREFSRRVFSLLQNRWVWMSPQ